MEKLIKVNTHHAYLNTDIKFESKECLQIVDQLTKKKYYIKDSLNIRLCAGKHIFVSPGLEGEIVIDIEDAIKLGGGNIKRGFIFDDNPWVFVVTKDRLYATNLETKEEKIEYNLAPDEIVAHSSWGNSACPYFLFKTNKDYSIYNILTGTHIVCFSEYIYSNTHLVIFRKEDGNIVVYDYCMKETVIEFNGQYSISGGRILYFTKDEKLFLLNLNTNHTHNIDTVGKIDIHCTLSGSYILKYCSGTRWQKNYELYSLGYYPKDVTKILLVTPHYIESIKGIKTYEYTQLVEQYLLFRREHKLLFNQNYDIDVCCIGIRIEDIQIQKNLDNGANNVIFGHVVSYPAKSFETPFVWPAKSGDTMLFERQVAIDTTNSNVVTISNQDDTTAINRNVIGTSLSKSLTLYTKEGCIFMDNSADNSTKQLFKNLFDVSSYNHAYFTSDGKSVVFASSNKVVELMGFEDMIKHPFDIEGATLPHSIGYNGYIPDIVLVNGMAGKPVWRDPISLQRITDLSRCNRAFQSPDGLYSAEANMKTVYFNRLTNSEITRDQYNELCSRYNWTNGTSPDNKNKIELRKQLLSQYGKHQLFYNIREQEKPFTNKALEDLDINNISDFVSLFVDPLYYVCCKNNRSKKEYKILVGRNAWFLNYVSFSYDSRFLAFGAKMKQDTWRFSEEGVFVLYDLCKDAAVVRHDTDINLHAVWMSMFSKTGDVAFYDSHANAYIATAESEYQVLKEAEGKSLLCFSPSGKYIALSDQNYISHKYHPNSEWGHQPSGNVFVHSVENFNQAIEQYNDLGSGVRGVSCYTRKAGSVASAAFSADEKRLLVVGDDGVIVIRNLKTSQ